VLALITATFGRRLAFLPTPKVIEPQETNYEGLMIEGH